MVSRAISRKGGDIGSEESGMRRLLDNPAFLGFAGGVLLMSQGSDRGWRVYLVGTLALLVTASLVMTAARWLRAWWHRPVAHWEEREARWERERQLDAAVERARRMRQQSRTTGDGSV